MEFANRMNQKMFDLLAVLSLFTQMIQGKIQVEHRANQFTSFYGFEPSSRT